MLALHCRHALRHFRAAMLAPDTRCRLRHDTLLRLITPVNGFRATPCHYALMLPLPACQRCFRRRRCSRYLMLPLISLQGRRVTPRAAILR